MLLKRLIRTTIGVSENLEIVAQIFRYIRNLEVWRGNSETQALGVIDQNWIPITRKSKI